MSKDTGQGNTPCVEIYTDGGCEPNPGPGGFGIVLLHPRKRLEVSGGFRLTTNNRMELYAAIRALELLKTPCSVKLFSDSQYLVKAMNDGWATAWKSRGWWRSNKERVLNVDLWEKLLLLSQKHTVRFFWIKGHAANKENERCDQLCVAALRMPDLPPDEGYEDKHEEGTRPRLTQEGQPCWKCGTPVLKQQSRKKHRDHYYEYYLWCPKCQATYLVEEAKRALEQPPSLFSDLT